MGTVIPSCPSNAIVYNRSFCACPPGQLLEKATNRCTLFTANSTILADSGIDYYAVQLPETIFSFDTISKFTQSQAVFLEATAVFLLSWLLFCFFMRFMKLGDGKNIWFQIRWWISRLDICFSTRHWLDDQKVVTKRKTELGGTFSIASWILFIGLFAALLYQIISKRTIEVHKVTATNAPDLASFINDMEFNITTVSSMTCSNLRGLGTLVTGNPGSFDHRVVSLSSVMNYTCFNTSIGPTVTMKCSECRYYADYSYISWQFIDLPSAAATAVGFQFNLSARSHGDKRYLGFVSGTLKNGSSSDGTPVTFRGNDTNILKFNLFPRIFHNFDDLKIIQPLFHEFLPGSFFRETAPLQASLSSGGLINTTLFINYLSDYIIEVENRSIMGPVSFLADLGGLYCISISIFFYFLVQCEYRVKKLRNEDQVMRNIRRRLKAQQHWDKVRKFVMYTWDSHGLIDDSKSSRHGTKFNCLLAPSVRVDKSLHTRELSWTRGSQNSSDKSTVNQKVSVPDEESSFGKQSHKLKEKSPKELGAFDSKGRSLESKDSKQKHPIKDQVPVPARNAKERSTEISPQADRLIDDDYIPYPPSLEFKTKSDVDMSGIKKNLRDLHDYNLMLREKFLSTQSLLRTLTSKKTSSTESQTW